MAITGVHFKRLRQTHPFCLSSSKWEAVKRLRGSDAGMRNSLEQTCTCRWNHQVQSPGVAQHDFEECDALQGITVAGC